MKNQTISLIYVLCHHPLVNRIIEKTLTEAHHRVCPFSTAKIEGAGQCECVLIIDTYSVERWLEITLRFGLMKRQPVVLLTSNLKNQEEEIRILHLGVRAIVPIANLENELKPAVESVVAGRLWVRRNTLTEYVMRKGGPARQAPVFTAREEQIIACLLDGLSNKEIGHLLGISPRTVKFHVANVLRKVQVRNRRDLRQLKKVPQQNPQLLYRAVGA